MEISRGLVAIALFLLFSRGSASRGMSIGVPRVQRVVVADYGIAVHPKRGAAPTVDSGRSMVGLKSLQV
jgi:hypothetical protein